MEDGIVIVTPRAELDEVFAGAGDHVTVQLNVEWTLTRQQTHVAFLLHTLIAQHVLINQG